MTIAIDTVCTDADVAEEIGGADQLAEIIPDPWNNSAEQARQKALDDVLAHLAARRPPVMESDLYDVTELAQIVIYGALVRLYRFAKTSADDVWSTHHKEFTKLYSSALANLNPTTSSGGVASSLGVALHRR